MKMKALNTVIHDGKTYKPGQSFDVKDATQAEVLQAGGFAVPDEQAPAPNSKEAKAAAKAAAEKEAADKAAAEKAAAEAAAAEEAAAKAAAEAAAGGAGDGN